MVFPQTGHTEVPLAVLGGLCAVPSAVGGEKARISGLGEIGPQSGFAVLETEIEEEIPGRKPCWIGNMKS